MNLHIEHAHGLAVVRVDETRLMYPLLSDFSGAVLGLISGGEKKLLIDLSKVTYVDSATIGCFMDLYRQASAAGVHAEAVGRAEAGRNDAHDDRGTELSRAACGRGERRQELRELAMRTIKTSSGAEVSLDGDLLSIMEALYHEVTAQRALERSFEDMVREIDHLIAQMSAEELRSYLAESLFLNTVKYENDRLEAYMRKLEQAGGAKGSASP